MARTPKTPTSAARVTSTSIVRVGNCNPLAMDRTTTPSKAVTKETKLPVAAAIEQIVANKDSTDGGLFSPDRKATDNRGGSELQPDLYRRTTEGDTTHKAKKHQFDKQAKDARVAKSGQPKRGRPKMTNGRRGG